MFNGGNKQPATKKQKAKPIVRDNAVTILTSGCHFNGKLYCRGSSRIGGRIEGQIVSEGLLIIEEGAVITAEVSAEEAIIQGEVQGRLKASGRVELCASARFDGDIISPVLIVNEGAQFNGRSCMMSADGKLPDRIPAEPDARPTGKGDVAILKVPEVNVPTN